MAAKTVAKPQVTDQAAKGGAMGLFVYFAAKYNLDPALMALAMPLIGAVFAYASTKIGDPQIASFFSQKAESE